MPIPNKILPPLKLSTAERILKKVNSLDGQTFTIRQLAKGLRPRLKYDVIRYHLENLCDNLYLEKLPNSGYRGEPQVYRWADGISKLEREIPDGGPASMVLRELTHYAFSLREGLNVEQEELENSKNGLKFKMDFYAQELRYMEMLYNCADLWQKQTLVNRLGFRE